MRAIKFILLFVLFTVVTITGGTIIKRFEGTPPSVQFIGLGDSVRGTQSVRLSLADPQSGLRKVSAVLRMKDKEISILDKTFPARGIFGGGAIKEEVVPAKIDLSGQHLPDGEAEIAVTVRDYSWQRWWNGNKTEVVRRVALDTRLPEIEVLSRQHNLRQGGSGMIIYKLSEPCPKTGVMVGENFFPAYPAEKVLGEKASQTYIAMMALSYKQNRKTPVQLIAVDMAGNESRTGFYYHLKNHQFIKDTIKIPDTFLNQKVPGFASKLSGKHKTQIERFLEINRDIRKANNAIFRSLDKDPPNEFLWKEKFLRLPNSARRANFADHREYIYKGNVVDNQIHMGVDLASLARSPVPAANSGIVVYVGDIGIFGKTVVIGHGFGLMSTYSHLSRINVKKGQTLARGDIIGKTGTTGLAGGDHLHFGMMVHNTFVTPVEWWDRRWIRDNIMLKIKDAKAALSGDPS